MSLVPDVKFRMAVGGRKWLRKTQLRTRAAAAGPDGMSVRSGVKDVSSCDRHMLLSSECGGPELLYGSFRGRALLPATAYENKAVPCAQLGAQHSSPDGADG